jgi:hypothetical protein
MRGYDSREGQRNQRTINAKVMKKLVKSRRELLEKIDRPARRQSREVREAKKTAPRFPAPISPVVRLCRCRCAGEIARRMSIQGA